MVSPSFLIEQGSTATLIIVYLWYEIHHGRLDDYAHKLDETIYAVIALAREVEDVDEQAVADRLNGHSPDDLINNTEESHDHEH
ncbi:MAG: hypothetical protein ACOCY1_04700 [Halovenus sp.]